MNTKNNQGVLKNKNDNMNIINLNLMIWILMCMFKEEWETKTNQNCCEKNSKKTTKNLDIYAPGIDRENNMVLAILTTKQP